MIAGVDGTREGTGTTREVGTVTVMFTDLAGSTAMRAAWARRRPTVCGTATAKKHGAGHQSRTTRVTTHAMWRSEAHQRNATTPALDIHG